MISTFAKLAACLGLALSLSGCVTVATAVASNEDVQDAAIDGILDFMDM